MARSRRLIRVLAVAAVLAAVDQIAKRRAVAHLEGEPAAVLGPGVRLRLVENDGLAWSAGRDLPLEVRRGLGVGGALLALAAVLFAARANPAPTLPALGLLAGGLTGNLIDRLVRGPVVDFLELGLPGRPVVNLADGFLVAGAVGLVSAWARGRRGHRASEVPDRGARFGDRDDERP